ncbi:MAG: nuclear transport factor 2 family protein [Cyclobacteriaceae bacterium]|nr:nuclear transport factor 2 family protein [Cyclobacteriaceae bacterium]
MRILLTLFILSWVIPAAAQLDQEKTVLSLSAKKFDWLIHKQADSLDRVLDARVQYVHSNGWIQNKKEVLEDLRSGKLVYEKVTVKEATVRLYGKTAIVNGLGTFEGINNGTAFRMDLRYTEVYIQTSGGWLLASRHSNRMP